MLPRLFCLSVEATKAVFLLSMLSWLCLLPANASKAVFPGYLVSIGPHAGVCCAAVSYGAFIAAADASCIGESQYGMPQGIAAPAAACGVVQVFSCVPWFSNLTGGK
jgi:hypothetical protein